MAPQQNLGPRYTFIIAAACGVLGVLVTFFFIRNDLDRDLAIEDAQFEAYLASKGWTGTIGSEDAKLTKAVSNDEKKNDNVDQDSEEEK